MNVEALKLAMKAIELERAPVGEWDQGKYIAGQLIATGESVRPGKAPEGSFLADDIRYYVATVTCGTTMCLAGQLAHQAGWVPVMTSEDLAQGSAWACMNPETKEVDSMHSVAQGILGVSKHVAHDLFVASSNIRDLDEFKTYVTNVTNVTFD